MLPICGSSYEPMDRDHRGFLGSRTGGGEEEKLAGAMNDIIEFHAALIPRVQGPGPRSYATTDSQESFPASGTRISEGFDFRDPIRDTRPRILFNLERHPKVPATFQGRIELA